jgi:hypothetical protein
MPYICQYDHTPEEGGMMAERKQVVGLFVDRSRQQWIVRDPEGNFWTVPSAELPWEQRQPYHPTAETELEPVPGHYREMLRLPF